jgi:hypothetical protein
MISCCSDGFREAPQQHNFADGRKDDVHCSAINSLRARVCGKGQFRYSSTGAFEIVHLRCSTAGAGLMGLATPRVTAPSTAAKIVHSFIVYMHCCRL